MLFHDPKIFQETYKIANYANLKLRKIGENEGRLIMKIAIAGAGAMGSNFGQQLKKAGNDVTLIDSWDKNIAAVRKDGVIAKINGKEMTQKMPIYSPAEIDEKKENADLLIVFTKSMQLESMLNSLKPIVNQDTYVLCLLNGLCHEEVLGKFVKKDHILTLAVKKKRKKSFKFWMMRV